MKIFGIAAICLFLVPLAAEACLPVQDILEWQAIEDSLNITNGTLVHLAERQCNRCYDKDDTDRFFNLTNAKVDYQVEYIETLLEVTNFEDINTQVDTRMDNWSQAILSEVRYDELQLIMAIYNSTVNTSSEKENLSLAGYATVSYVDDKLGKLELRVDNVALNQPPITGTVTADQGTDWTWLIGGLVVVVIFIILLSKLNLLPKLPKRYGPPLSEQQQPAMTRTPDNSMPDRENVNELRLRKLKDLALESKLDMIKRKMDAAKKKGDEEEINKLQKKAEETIEEAVG